MCVEVLAHRGLWRSHAEKNTLAALVAALAAGFGLETDVRDCGGHLVISHDPPRETALHLDVFLAEYRQLNSAATLALNVKADGLALALRDMLSEYGVQQYFVFDMSVPDTLHYAKLEMPFYSRLSEHEPQIALYEQCAGVWLDAFGSDWYEPQVVSRLCQDGKRVCVVSPELHRRPHLPLWQQLSNIPSSCASGLLVCTDHPHACSEFFR